MVTDYKFYALNSLEQRLAKVMGKERCKNNQNRNVKEQIQSQRDPVEISIEGCAGELVACRHYNAYPDLETDISPTDYPDADLIVSNIKVDVKTTHWDFDKPNKHPETMWASRKNDRKAKSDVDVYVFVRGSMPKYQICGWQYKSEHQKYEKTNPRTGEAYYYCLEKHLRPMYESYDPNFFYKKS